MEKDSAELSKNVINTTKEWLFNVELLKKDLALNKETSFLYHKINIEKTNYLLSLPWYKTITKKQRDKISKDLSYIERKIFHDSDLDKLTDEIKTFTFSEFDKELGEKIKNKNQNN